MRSIDMEIEFYLMMIRGYRFAMSELVECRLELGDIEAKFQPVKACRTDREILQNYFNDNSQYIFEKIRQEEYVKKRFDEANMILNKVDEIMTYIVDPIEQEMIRYLYMSSINHSRQDFANKFNYDVKSIYHKVNAIIKKAVKLKLRNT